MVRSIEEELKSAMGVSALRLAAVGKTPSRKRGPEKIIAIFGKDLKYRLLSHLTSSD